MKLLIDTNISLFGPLKNSYKFFPRNSKTKTKAPAAGKRFAAFAGAFLFSRIAIRGEMGL